MPSAGRVAILISGRGSNMLALLDAMRDGRIDAQAALVVSNRGDAAGLAAAAARGVPTVVVEQRECGSGAEHEHGVLAALGPHEVDLVCLAGYMRLLGPTFLAAFPQRILNIHPSLLPAFPGLHAQRQALRHGAKVSGCTVHVVDEQCDHGPIVLQASVPVHDDDTEDTLAARILEQEHVLYPRAVALYFARRLRFEGRRVRIAAAAGR